MTAETLPLPNMRKMFIPDEGYVIIDADLERADAQVVAWEAGDEELKQMFREGEDVHTQNAKTIFKLNREPTYQERQKAKAGVHAVNYGTSAPTLAKALGSSTKEAEDFINRWMEAHPAIKDWHERVWFEVRTTKTVKNPFGFRMLFFDRVNVKLWNEALAWVPQCLPRDTEVLTQDGWEEIGAAMQSEKRLAVWGDGKIWFEAPERWHEGQASRMVHMKDLGYSCTPNHRIPYYTPGKEKLQTTQAVCLPKCARVPSVGLYEAGRETPSKAMITYLTALQADGCLDAKGRLSFEFSKQAKIDRFAWALDTLKLSYTRSVVRRGATTFYVHKDNIPYSDRKFYGEWLLNWCGEALDYWLEELSHWDGWKDKHGVVWYSSNVEANCAWVMAIAHLRGKKCRYLSEDNRGNKTCYRVAITPNKGKRINPNKREMVILDSPIKVVCPTVSTGYFLVRGKGGIVSVTGNSTVANVTNEGLKNIDKHLSGPDWGVELLLQVHDSLVMQAPLDKCPDVFDKVKEAMTIKVPYKDPLYIPVGVDVSHKSWGDVTSVKKWREAYGV